MYLIDIIGKEKALGSFVSNIHTHTTCLLLVVYGRVDKHVLIINDRYN